jgi:hypothetical protein
MDVGWLPPAFLGGSGSERVHNLLLEHQRIVEILIFGVGIDTGLQEPALPTTSRTHMFFVHKGGSVGERAKNARGKGRQNKSPCCVSWAGETQALSCEKTRQEPTPRQANTSLEGIQKQNHIAKPHGQKIQKIRENTHMAKRYARNMGESN